MSIGQSVQNFRHFTAVDQEDREPFPRIAIPLPRLQA